MLTPPCLALYTIYMVKTKRKSAVKTTRARIHKKDFKYDTPIYAFEEWYGFKTGFPPDTKLGDVAKKIAPSALRYMPR